MKWMYGVTSVDDRDYRILKGTLDSLAAAGFSDPVVFMDDLERGQKLGAFGNWIRAAWELYIRDPKADRYCIFQDDIKVVSNLRSLLERTEISDLTYLNLYSVAKNDRGFENIGWHPVKQKGQGALALVFSNHALRTLLQSPVMVSHPQTKHGTVDIDGTISFALDQHDYQELSHSPSLVTHTGIESTIGNVEHPEESGGWSEDMLRNYGRSAEPSSILKDSGPRIGFVGYNAPTGLGEKSRQITSYLPISHWLIKPHKAYGEAEYSPSCKTTIADSHDEHEVEQFVLSVDVVLFDEVPMYPSLINMCKKHGRRIVCIPAMEWLPNVDRWPTYVDLFICPTEQCYRMFKDQLPCVCFPWPIDTQRFNYVKRDTCSTFLYCHGQGGVHDRKGGQVIQEVLALWPEMPLLVRTQKKALWPDSIRTLGQVDHNYELYQEGDVLISPHSVDGTGLEHMEAMACGMPVITTDGDPWNEAPALARIHAKETTKELGREVTWYIPDAAHLVKICKEWLGEDVSTPSRLAHKWAMSRSFDIKAEQLLHLVLNGDI